MVQLRQYCEARIHVIKYRTFAVAGEGKIQDSQRFSRWGPSVVAFIVLRSEENQRKPQIMQLIQVWLCFFCQVCAAASIPRIKKNPFFRSPIVLEIESIFQIVPSLPQFPSYNASWTKNAVLFCGVPCVSELCRWYRLFRMIRKLLVTLVKTRNTISNSYRSISHHTRNIISASLFFSYRSL